MADTILLDTIMSMLGDSECPARSRCTGSTSEDSATQRAIEVPTTVSTECHP